jgi:bifunctional oligoribonuclease and PAP phosphatase NrnA
MIKQIIDQLKKSRTILVVSHTNPDGDAIGALLAAGLAFKAIGKKVHIVNESAIPAVYRFLPSIKHISHRLDAAETFDTVVVLDCGSLERVGTLNSRICQAPMIINIDHHMTNTQFGHLHLIDPDACATSELIYRIIQQLNIEFTCSIAMAIYTGILTDTGSFRFSNTNHAAFAICAEMIASGADPYDVAQHVYGHYSLGRIKLLNLALDSLEISPNGKMSFMTLTQRMLKLTGTQAEDIDGIINYARRIEDVEVAVLIHETGSEPAVPGSSRRDFHVSLRSDGNVNVADIAAKFGGGGHANAAGFSVVSSLQEIKAKMYEISETTPELWVVN